ncbi:MAG: hypothetical protein HW380_2531 [Magnetococcales bacterium]|nr:hypothetical protein [Magnetococcales bacterium]
MRRPRRTIRAVPGPSFELSSRPFGIALVFAGVKDLLPEWPRVHDQGKRQTTVFL